MKKILILAIVLFCTRVHAQQVTEGIIKFTMELISGTGGNSNAGNMSATIYFKKDKSLTEMITPIYITKTLSDNNGLLILVNANGKKTYKLKSKSLLDKERTARKNFAPVIESTKEKKNILGYECTKSYITLPGSKGAQNKMAVWHTPRITNSTTNLGGVTPDMAKKIKGTVLEIDIEQGPVTSRMRAVSISTKPVPDAIFNLSTAGYTERKEITIN